MQSEKKNTIIAILIGLTACIIWSGNFVIARGVHEWMNPIGFAFWRWIVAFSCIAPFALPHLKTNLKYFKQNPKIYIAMGFIGVGFFNTVIYQAAHFTTANNISLLAATSPIWTLFLAGVFKLEPLNRNKIIGIFVAFSGALSIILKGDISTILHMDFNKGDMMVLVASWAWAFYSLVVKFKHKDMNPFFLMFLITFFGLLVLTPMYGIEIYYKGATPFSMKALYVYLYVGIGASVIAWYLFNKSIFMVGAVRTSLIYYTMPIFSGILSIIYLGEHFSLYHAAGFLLILSGIIISNFSGKKSTK
jgi:drug/metabolite transporter (DMT)-like permease